MLARLLNYAIPICMFLWGFVLLCKPKDHRDFCAALILLIGAAWTQYSLGKRAR